MLQRLSSNIHRNLSRRFLRYFSAQEGGLQSYTGPSSDVSRFTRLQFSKEKLEFGELPKGEIPDALAVDRPSGLSKLDNGVRVASQTFSDTGVVTLGFYWQFGSRHENIDNSGVCNFVNRLQFRGTKTRDRTTIDNDVQAVGGELKMVHERERTGFSLTVPKTKLNEAVAYPK